MPIPTKYKKEKIREVSDYLRYWLKDSTVPKKGAKKIEKKTWIISEKEEKALGVVINLLNDCV